ncbi:Autophagy-related protein [Drosera capensis]
MGMRNDVKGGLGRANGFIPSSFRAFSSYLKIVSSGASTVASSVRSAASAIVDRDDDARRDQVLWAGFDKLECGGGAIRKVLLLGYRYGFQVWDVEEAHNVRYLVSRQDGAVSFLQMLPRPLEAIRPDDKFSESRPLLVLCSDASGSVASSVQDGKSSCNGSSTNCREPGSGGSGSSVVQFYSLSSQSYVHLLKFRSVVFSIRSSARVIVISQSAQIHCINAATLEREYTILTNPIVAGAPGCGGVSYGPLAVGPRWLAYSGSPVALSDTGCVNPQHLTPSASFPSSAPDGSLVAHYAMESSKQLAAGIVKLGDIGYKKLSQYYSELRPDTIQLVQSGSPRKSNGNTDGNSLDMDGVGMVIVRDAASKTVIAQFRAHKSPISALCFDPSGILLVTASVQGHNINVFRIMPGLVRNSSTFDAEKSYVHLYRLQRGLTNAVIQDISFSDDSRWIMVSSSRGTNHLFAISPFGGSADIPLGDSSFKDIEQSGNSNSTLRWPSDTDLEANPLTICASGPPVTLSVVSRIRSGSNSGWKGTLTGAAAAASGRTGSLSGAIASSFHYCKGSDSHGEACSLKAKYHLLVYSPSGSLIQYALWLSSGLDSAAGSLSYDSSSGYESKLVVEAMQKWNICQKQVRREREDNTDVYGENAKSDLGKAFTEGNRKPYSFHPVKISSVSRTKISPEDRHHLYISEAELQMHQERTPLWAKPTIYFESMMATSSKLLEETTAGGETEIERVSIRPMEAKPKNLIRVFDYLQTPKSQNTRPSSGNPGMQRQRQVSGVYQNSGLSSRSSCGSLDSLMERSAAEGFVKSHSSPKTMSKLEDVYNKDRERLATQARLKTVNSTNRALRTENHIEDQGDGFD